MNTDIFFYEKGNPMLFNSELFLLLFTVFIGIYALIYQHKTARTWYVIAFSLYFYYKSSGGYLVILLFSVLLDYLIAWHIHQHPNEKERRFWYLFSVTANLLLLAYFKYTNFFLENLSFLTGKPFQFQDLILPVGISFYTFQTISYVTDVYHRNIAPADNLGDYTFYMTFFPHLVAGPIVRASHFLPQLTSKITLTEARTHAGMYLVLKGLIKKAIIGDYVAQFADLVFSEPQHYSGFENWIAIYAYALQIYCDFSGYSDMAMGFANLMGFDLGENFRQPYQAVSLTDFWRRWHISLSRWLRDYVYIPLGGNRKGETRQQLYLLATMLIGGLWHGASWKFVFWGGMHGVGLVCHKYFEKYTRYLHIPAGQQAGYRFLAGWLTFHFVAVLWVFFRASSFEMAGLVLQKAATEMDIRYLSPFLQGHALFVAVLLLGYGLLWLPPFRKEQVYERFAGLPLWAKAVVFLGVFQLVLQFRSETVQPFIYFQF